MKKLSLLMITFIISLSSQASVSDKYFQLKSVQLKSGETVVKEIDFVQDADPEDFICAVEDEFEFRKGAGQLGEVLASVDQIIALGEKIYKIIEKGRPVLQTSYAPVSVLPKDSNGQIVDIFSTEGWSRPVTKSYSVEYKNMYNMTVVKFQFTLVYSYGGSYQGKGKYITAAQIIPAAVEVAWGFNVSAVMNLDSMLNLGTVASPVAGINLRLNYTINTVVKAEERNVMFFIAGDGQSKMY